VVNESGCDEGNPPAPLERDLDELVDKLSSSLRSTKPGSPSTDSSSHGFEIIELAVSESV